MKRFVLGVALAPTAVCALYAAALAAVPVAQGWRFSYPFWAGLALYLPAHFLLSSSSRVYVFGHELTHAVAAVLSGARVRRFVAGKESGHVVVSRSNAFIALAPYAVPLYSVLVLAGYRLASLRWGGPGLYAAFLAAMGATLAFHLLSTADTLLGAPQKDLRQAGGVLFSMSLIGLANAVVVAGLFKLLFPGAVSLHAFAASVAAGTAVFWTRAYAAAAALAEAVRARLARGP